MRIMFAALAIGLCAIGGAADARGHSSGSHHAHSTHTSHAGSDYYTNVSGHRVHRPVFAHHAPRGASARCGDGSYSFSEHHQGTCSHHGGVAGWL